MFRYIREFFQKTHYDHTTIPVRDTNNESQYAYEYGCIEYSELSYIPLSKINIPKIWCQGKYDNVLNGIINKATIPPIMLDNPDENGKYTIIDGIHRSNASMDYGFTHIPCVISYCIETPELYRPPPELPLFKSGTWVLIRCSSNYYKEHKADSDWAIILEHYRTINSNKRKRHQYTCAKWCNGRVSLSDQFDFNMFPEGITHPSSAYKKKLLKNLKRHWGDNSIFKRYFNNKCEKKKKERIKL